VNSALFKLHLKTACNLMLNSLSGNEFSYNIYSVAEDIVLIEIMAGFTISTCKS